MAMTPGFCKNLDYCSIASQRRVVQVGIGEAFACPECGRALSPPAIGGKSSGRSLLPFALAALVLGGGGGFAAVSYLRSPGTPAARDAAREATAAPASDPGAADARPSAAKPADTAAAITPAGTKTADAKPESAASAAPASLGPPPRTDVAATPAAPAAVAAGSAPPAIAAAATPALALSQAPAALPAPVPAPVPQALVLLRLDGATAMQAQLGPKLAAAYLASVGDTDILEQRDASRHRITVSGLRGTQREAIVLDSYSATHGFSSLAAGDTDIAVSTRRIKPAEHDAMAALGDMTASASEHVLALDGIAVVVNPANRVAQLDTNQLRAIYSGAITNWVQLGGEPRPITLWARNKESGTYDTFAEMVLGNSRLSSMTHVSDDDTAIAGAVAADPGGIGFVSQAHVGAARALAVAAAGGVASRPTQLSLSTEDYPFTRRLYLYTAAAPKNPFVSRFAEFAQSPPGQAVVETVGFVPLTVQRVAAAAPASAPEKYRQLVAGATRLSVDFRFLPGSTDLDNRGVRDFNRVIGVLTTSHAQAGALELFGFADAQGSPASNMALARRRVDAVAAAFSRAGVRPGRVEAFGSELPIADNATQEGREKNRRVEVYLQTASR